MPALRKHSMAVTRQTLPSHVKSTSTTVRTSQSCLPSGSPPLLQRDPVSHAHPQEKSRCLKDQPTTPVLGKHSTAVPRQTLPGHGEYNSTRKKKTTSKMKKLRNHPQLNQQENSPKAVNNETDLCSLTDLEFKREIVKILKELREDMNSNADPSEKN